VGVKVGVCVGVGVGGLIQSSQSLNGPEITVISIGEVVHPVKLSITVKQSADQSL
jgi:hypothetical protein